jgi:glycerophosphoryl diester phosphodiesterase
MKDNSKRHFFKIAHRGASAYEPENTLRSFRRAIELGADMIEFDVRLSLDGHPVIIHDKKVDRTTNGHGLVREMTLSELKKLDAGKGEKIPTLEEVIEFGKGKTRFVVELKEGGTEEKVMEIIRRENNLIEDVFIVSFHRNLVKRVKELEPKIRAGLIFLFSFSPVRNGRECLADAVAPFHLFVTKGLVEKAHKSGMFFFTWTVDDPKRAKKLKDMGVDGIVTNRPDLI